jgi:hypothetical protein
MHLGGGFSFAHKESRMNWLNLGFSVLLELVQETIPNDPTQKSKWRKALLKLFKGIARIYADDPDFKTAMPNK